LKGTVTIETSGQRYKETARWIDELGAKFGLPLKSKGAIILKSKRFMISRRGQTLVNNWHEKPAHDRHVSSFVVNINVGSRSDIEDTFQLSTHPRRHKIFRITMAITTLVVHPS